MYAVIAVVIDWPNITCLLSGIGLSLANINSRSRSVYAVIRPSVCRLSVTLVHPPQAVKIFGNISRHLTPWPSVGTNEKFYGDRPRETPQSGELNTRGVAKYSDFGHIEGYISETVQDRTKISINH